MLRTTLAFVTALLLMAPAVSNAATFNPTVFASPTSLNQAAQVDQSYQLFVNSDGLNVTADFFKMTITGAAFGSNTSFVGAIGGHLQNNSSTAFRSISNSNIPGPSGNALLIGTLFVTTNGSSGFIDLDPGFAGSFTFSFGASSSAPSFQSSVTDFSATAVTQPSGHFIDIVPEPSSAVLAALGLSGLACLRRRRRA